MVFSTTESKLKTESLFDSFNIILYHTQTNRVKQTGSRFIVKWLPLLSSYRNNVCANDQLIIIETNSNSFGFLSKTLFIFSSVFAGIFVSDQRLHDDLYISHDVLTWEIVFLFASKKTAFNQLNLVRISTVNHIFIIITSVSQFQHHFFQNKQDIKKKRTDRAVNEIKHWMMIFICHHFTATLFAMYLSCNYVSLFTIHL